jgi:two-component system KDP operon response regulator KdpE
LKEVWGTTHLHDTHYLRIFVRKLRQKIEPHPDSPRILVTELGVGYRLAQSEADSGAWTAAQAAPAQAPAKP